MPDPNPPAYRVELSLNPLPTDPFALLIGDFLHGVRSGLDQLAYSLAEAHTGSPLGKQMAEDSEFPIFGDENRKGVPGRGPDLFRSNQRKIAAVAPAAVAVIKGFQPYQRGPSWRMDALWIIYELARIDRHRLLHLATSSSSHLAYSIPDRPR